MTPVDLKHCIFAIADKAKLGYSFEEHLDALVAHDADQRRRVAELESLSPACREMMDAITRIVWGFDPQELLTVGQYGADVERVWARLQAQRDEWESRFLRVDRLRHVLSEDLQAPDDEWRSENEKQAQQIAGMREAVSLFLSGLTPHDRGKLCLSADVFKLEQALASVPAQEVLDRELAVWLCPVHKSLDDRGELRPLDNCVACLRVERDELRASILDASSSQRSNEALANVDELRGKVTPQPSAPASEVVGGLNIRLALKTCLKVLESTEHICGDQFCGVGGDCCRSCKAQRAAIAAAKEALN